MNHLDNRKASSFLRKLLIAPGYRAARHILLISILVIIGLNQAFMTMREGLEIVGNKIFIQALFTFTTYMLVCYFNLYVLLPRYLLKKDYSRYTLFLAITVFFLVTGQTMEERAVLIHIGILDDFYTAPRLYINILSSFILVSLCISGGAMTVLLKHWMTDNEKVEQLEKLHIQSKVEQLKEQVNPHLLFNILNRTGVLAKNRPEEASDMIIRLSQLLRYQLYDCNREKVLLSAEIKFINNYLALEQMYAHSFRFNIWSDMGCSHVVVSPLLFISFVQSAVIRIYEKDKATSVHVKFKTTDNKVTFTCGSEWENIFADTDFTRISQRLELLYKNHYSLVIENNNVTLELEI
ncbi:sensor histidine kinase [Phocaeicola sp.]